MVALPADLSSYRITERDKGSTMGVFDHLLAGAATVAGHFAILLLFWPEQGLN